MIYLYAFFITIVLLAAIAYAWSITLHVGEVHDQYDARIKFLRDEHRKEVSDLRHQINVANDAIAEAQSEISNARFQLNMAQIDTIFPSPLHNTRIEYDICTRSGRELRTLTLSVDKSRLNPDSIEFYLGCGFASAGFEGLYGHSCFGCSLCRPVRVDVRAKRSQRELKAIRKSKLTMMVSSTEGTNDLSREHLDLVKKYSKARHDVSLLCLTFAMYGRKGQGLLFDFYDETSTLRGMVLATQYTPDTIEAHLHIYDPDWSQSTGTAILAMFYEWACDQGLAHAYLGHTNAGKFDYKRQFGGSEVLTSMDWIDAKLEEAILTNNRSFLDKP
jgi:arginyl-tRNA--protein-N-Asp/Glu arginylyltransferase